MLNLSRLLLIIFASGTLSAQNFAQYVNPFIGTGGHGHTFPGATAPFGMVQLSPDTRVDDSWDGCSGYHYSDSVIYGFSHTHLNGTGVSDYGDMMLMPTMGTPSLDPRAYASSFSHRNESASAGFYSVKLDRDNIFVELTATPRVGYQQYTFSKSGQANIILDLNHRDELLEGEVRIINNKTIEVFRRSRGWAQNQYLYARIEFSKPIKISNATANAKMGGGLYSGTKLALAFSADVKKDEKILVKVALSPVSYAGAERNMLAEGQSNDFYQVSGAAMNLWNKELSKIEVSSDDRDKLAIFYTALYHVFTQPNIYQDADGQYRGRDNKIHSANFGYYTVFSLWDTFRAAHPLMTLIDKKRSADFINTFIAQYQQGGRLPVWEFAANETDCMIGYHAVSVIADAMMKGIKGFDYEKAYEAAKNSAKLDIFGLNAYKQNNYIAIDDEHESVSKTVEYAYDDWCIAQMARLLGKSDDYQYFMHRSQNWKNLYNSKTGFIQPRKNGSWLAPFDAREVNSNYTEGNSWQYSFFVPQDVEGLVRAHGGKDKFEKFLDELFTAPQQTTGREQVDITGLIGQYAHGNEPSHHMAYLYEKIGKPEKTDTKVKFILDNFYKNAPDGLIGNEDCGQMSAWYVLSAMGIYSVTPGLPEWSTTKPYFSHIKLHLEDGRMIEITPQTPRKTLAKLGFEHINPLPKHKVPSQTPAPIVKSDRIFDRDARVEIEALEAGGRLFYASSNADDAQIPTKFTRYKKPFVIRESTTVFAYAVKNGEKSSIVKAKFFRRPNDWSVAISGKYSSQFSAGGDLGLIDRIHGTENWRKGEWQGYQGQNFEAVIDLKTTHSIRKLGATFLQDSRAWILMPTKVEFYVSGNNRDFIRVADISNSLDPRDTAVQIKNFGAEILPTEARYVKIIAYNFGKLPDWHQGAGSDAFIFVDEVSIE